MDKQEVLGGLTDDDDKIVTTNPQTSEDGFPAEIVVNVVNTRQSSTKEDAIQKQKY